MPIQNVIRTNETFFRNSRTGDSTATHFAEVHELFQQQIAGFGFPGTAFAADHYGLVGFLVEHKLIRRVSNRENVRRIRSSHLIAIFLLFLRESNGHYA